jgi:hypothetical protein
VRDLLVDFSCAPCGIRLELGYSAGQAHAQPSIHACGELLSQYEALCVGATEGGIGGAVTVMRVSAFALSELVPTELVWWVRTTAPIVIRTPTPSAAESAFTVPRRRPKLM